MPPPARGIKSRAFRFQVDCVPAVEENGLCPAADVNVRRSVCGLVGKWRGKRGPGCDTRRRTVRRLRAACCRKHLSIWKSLQNICSVLEVEQRPITHSLLGHRVRGSFEVDDAFPLSAQNLRAQARDRTLFGISRSRSAVQILSASRYPL
jgi:hypothetical protein